MKTIDLVRRRYDEFVTNPNNPFTGMESMTLAIIAEHSINQREAEYATLFVHAERQHDQIAKLRSNAATARELIDNLKDINDALKILIHGASYTNDPAMANALTLIQKVQFDLHHQLLSSLS